MTMYTKKTLAKELYDAQVNGLSNLAVQIGLKGFDPLESCDGLIWLKSLIDYNPEMTLDEVIPAFKAAEGDKGAWAAGLLRIQIDNLYPEFRKAMMDALHGDNCTEVAMCARHKLTPQEKDDLKKQFRSREIPSSDLEAALL